MRVVVVTGAGERAFCAGGDKHLDLPVLSTLGSAGMVADARIAQDTILRIRELDKPVIARVNGVAVGGGCDIALACDIVIASRTASFGEFWILRVRSCPRRAAALLPPAGSWGPTAPRS